MTKKTLIFRHFDSGPLFYYPGSHTVNKFNFGNGIFFNKKSTLNPTDFAKYLDKTCQEAGLQKKMLFLKKGDILIWHAALAHGGEEIRNPAQTRKSFVCHYSSGSAYKHHRQSPNVEPVRRTMNGAAVVKTKSNLLNYFTHLHIHKPLP